MAGIASDSGRLRVRRTLPGDATALFRQLIVSASQGDKVALAQAGIASPDLLVSLLPSWHRSLAAANKSERTISRYIDDTQLFATYLKDNRLPEAIAAITREQVEMFVSDQLRRHRPASAATRYRSLAQFWKWAVEEGEVKVSPMARMKPPIVPEVPIPVVPEADLVRLLATCEKGSSFRDRRDAALFLALIDAGLRAGELCGIAAEDVGLDRGIVRVTHGKGRRVRNVPIGSRTAKALDRYARIRTAHKDAELPAYFLGVRGPITVSGLASILEARCREAGLDRINPHRLRHTSVHMALAGGASEGDAMSVYGWRSRQMLNRYGASMAEERAIAAHKRHFGPADRLGQRRP